MKKLIFYTLLLSASSIWCYGQEIKLKDVRQQIKPIFRSTGEVSPDWDYFIWPAIMIVRESDNKEVKDENVIEQQEFAIYRLVRLAPHRTKYYIIVRKDRGYVVNMRRSLVEILSEALSIADDFALDYNESAIVITTLTDGFVDNKRYVNGTKIKNHLTWLDRYNR